MTAIWSLARKDLRLLMRDRMDMFFTLVFPLFIAMFFGTIFSGGGGGEAKGLPIAVLDEDQSELSLAFVKSLSSEEEFEVTTVTSREAGTERVRTGDEDAFVIIPKGFGESSDSMFRGQPATIEAVVDPSKKASTGMLQGLLTKHAFEQTFDCGNSAKMRERAQKSLARLQTDPAVSPQVKAALQPFLSSMDTFFKDLPAAIDAEAGTKKDADGKPAASAGWEPVKVELHTLEARKSTGPPSFYAVSFPQAVIWGVMGCALSFGISLTTERSSGTLTRLMLSPLHKWQILAGKGLACFLTILGVAAVLMGVGALVFKVHPVDPPMLVAAIVCTAIAFVGVMMLLAALSRTAGGGSGLGRAAMLCLAMIGGGSIPLFVMPRWMQTASSISPFKWAVQALDGAVWRGLTPAQMALPLCVLLGVGVVGFAVGARVFSWSAKS
jgi:ABC-2 type transport system permease protein